MVLSDDVDVLLRDVEMEASVIFYFFQSSLSMAADGWNNTY
jgi:hypothetical protein